MPPANSLINANQVPCLIIGGGGHTRVLIGAIKETGRPIRGILTRDTALIGRDILGVPVLGIEGEFDIAPESVAVVIGVGNHASRSGPGLDIRRGLFARYRDQGFAMPPIVSVAAFIAPDVTIGDSVQLMAGAVVQPGSFIGENVIINTSASVDHDAKVGAHSHVAPGAMLCGDVLIGEASHVGAGAIVLEGIQIGANCVIGAGCVVTRNVPDGSVLRRPA